MNTNVLFRLIAILIMLLTIQNLCTQLALMRSPPSFGLSSSDLSNGGVILFYHLPRTGGTTIRESFDVVRLSRPRQFHQVDEAIESENSTTLFEMHGNIPGLPALEEQISTWKSKAAQKNIPFHMFTTLRDPVDHQVSYFLHFHGLRCKWSWCEKDLYEVSPENLLQASIPNRQCSILYHGQSERKTETPPAVTDEQCNQVSQLLQKHMTWIGMTDSLPDTTLPLLAKLLKVPFVKAHSNARRKSLKLDEQMTARLRSLSSMDAKLIRDTVSQSDLFPR